ncbi:hypothetical protein ACAG25_04960 [Mycobacterium sp. pV006]|uniref:hypothetical protein n=1 Tax=Mycobacterium sp. pV006 TaxID=3238983 RepID=UPI00351AC735
MTRTSTWKVVTAGVALTGLGIVGAGTAATAAADPLPAVHSATAPQFDWAAAFVDDSPDVSYVAMDDSWDDSPWDDSPYDD